MKRVTHFRGIPLTSHSTGYSSGYLTGESVYLLLEGQYDHHLEQHTKTGKVIRLFEGSIELLTEYFEAHPEANLPPIDTKEPVPVTVSALHLESRLLVRDLGDLAT